MKTLSKIIDCILRVPVILIDILLIILFHIGERKEGRR